MFIAYNATKYSIFKKVFLFTKLYGLHFTYTATSAKNKGKIIIADIPIEG